LLGVLLTIAFVALTGTIVWGQSTAQISGTARDQSGAVLPGVEVNLTQTNTGLLRTVLTNETGSYVLPNLPIGPYKRLRHIYYESPGTAHEWLTWRRHLNDFAPRLFRR